MATTASRVNGAYGFRAKSGTWLSSGGSRSPARSTGALACGFRPAHPASASVAAAAARIADARS
jgi:hypothetical protein